MWNLSKAVAWKAEQLCPGRVAFYIANDWPYAPDPHTAYWLEPARNPVLKTVKHLISRLPLRVVEQDTLKYRLDFEHVMCVSQAVKENLALHAGLEECRMRVIHNGVETDLFIPHMRPGRRADAGLSLLYAGILAPHKGVHTAIEAMGILAREHKGPDITLSIAGSGNPDYESLLKKTVKEQGLEKQVRFLGRLPRSNMPELLRKFDALIFPSIWEEPLARVMQEGMASGLAVIGTLTGGTGELLVNGETGLTFEPGNAAGLAQQIERLFSERGLRDRLAENGRRAVVTRFGMDRMLDEVEAALTGIVSRNGAIPAAA
jgi:glycosyltransferase involved in cell wall biosynthesis